jgi:hypothetical protein
MVPRGNPLRKKGWLELPISDDLKMLSPMESRIVVCRGAASEVTAARGFSVSD